MSNLRHKTIYEFETFRLDAGYLMLYQNGQEILLAPKVVETLLALVERRGEVLGKEELMELVWADSIVEEGNLSQNLYRLRKILGEGKNGKPLIETLRRRGYRFNGEVRIIEQTSAAKNSENVLAFAPSVAGSAKPIKETKSGQLVALAEWQSHANDGSAPLEAPGIENRSVSDTVPIKRARWWLSNRKLIAAGVVLTAFLSGFAVWKVVNQNRSQASPDRLASTRVKSLARWNVEAGEGDSKPRFSPNGTMIAYSRTKNGQRNIWTKQVSEGKDNQITNDGEWSNFNPIWSPDGQRIAFVSNRDNQIAIWTMPFSGGGLTPLKVVESNVSLLHWSKNEATIYYQQRFNLFALDIASGQITQLTNFDATDQAQFFNISPGEDRIAYSSGPNERLHIFVMDLKDGQPVQVTDDDDASDEYPFWLPDGKRIIYSSKRGGIFQTCIVYLDEHRSEQINLGISDTLISDVAPGGDKILFSQASEESDLWRVDLDKNETQITSEAGRLELWPDASPDGKSIVLQTTSEAKHLLASAIELYSNDDKQPIKIAANGFSPTFSPDGRKIAFLRDADNLSNLWVTEKGTERQLTTRGIWVAGFSMMPYNRNEVKDYSWSPDGKSLIYCAGNDDLWNVWQVAADGLSEPRQISTNTEQNLKFSGPLFSPDGEQIAFVSSPLGPPSGAKKINHVNLLNKQNSGIVFSSESVVKLIGWKQPGGNLIVATLEGNAAAKPARVKLVRISAGNTITDLSFVDAAYFSNVQLSPDGQMIAYAAREEMKDNIWILSVLSGVKARITSNFEPNVYFSSLAWSSDSRAIYYGRQEKIESILMIENFK